LNEEFDGVVLSNSKYSNSSSLNALPSIVSMNFITSSNGNKNS
jgi:hypothetical protein